jgi:hypothetical protein
MLDLDESAFVIALMPYAIRPGKSQQRETKKNKAEGRFHRAIIATTIWHEQV